MTAQPLTSAPSGAETTSSLERYLAEISDPVLRENLSREIGGLKREFGLVFERHHPEGIRLPKHAVKRGSKVVISGAKDSVFYRVHRLNKEAGTAIIVDSDGNSSEHPVASLTVAKEFGDVMYPGLRKLSEIRRGDPDAPVHTIINGENYHALEALQYTHAGKVDLIYIDPPYNTGNADWKYNDRYVDAKDGYRHSKWLSFMEKRLQISRKLLSPAGLVFISIDDSEQARLKLLADQVFGSGNFLAVVPVINNLKGNNDQVGFAGIHEYLLVYFADAAVGKLQGIRATDAQISSYDLRDDLGSYKRGAHLRATGANAPRSKRPNLFYPIYVSEDMSSVSISRLADSDKEVWPLDASGNEMSWRWGKDRLASSLDEVIVSEQKSGKIDLFKKQRIDFADARIKPKSILMRPEYSGTTAAGAIQTLFDDRRFPYPKSHVLLMDIISMHPSSTAVVLDFFGGSGTTAEAVIRLNAEDGGTRQAILVTNNELSKADDTKLRKAGHAPGDDEYEALGVFHHVTKPRLETVVTGMREDGSTYSAGLDANIAFFELTYLDEPDIVRGTAFNDLAGLFWLKAGGIGGTVELTAGAKADGFAISESGRTAVLFTPGRAQALAEKLAATEHAISHLFIVTDSEAQGDEAATHFPGGITVERIYGSYLEAFQVNRKD